MEDGTATLFTTAFDSIAELILGQSAEQTASLSAAGILEFIEERILESRSEDYKILSSARFNQSVEAPNLVLVATKMDLKSSNESPSTNI